MISSKDRRQLVILALLALVLSVYWQAGEFAFINLDDNRYVYNNQHVLRGLTPAGIVWAFTSFDTGNWHPLTWLSHMADVEAFGPAAAWHHRTNVLLHLLNTALLFLALERLTGGFWRSALVAALFGVHPLHVESVAWVAERKDLLSALFWTLTLRAYVRYARRPGGVRYLPVALCFALGLLCKPMLVTLPFVLLLLDWWPLGRFGPGPLSLEKLPGLVREKMPLLALTAASSAITILAQAAAGAIMPLDAIGFGPRLANAISSYVRYLEKTAWPTTLAVFYPHPGEFGAEIPGWRIAGALLLLVGVTVLVAWQRRARPHLLVGWLWYLGTLVPVAGFVQVGAQALADRYTYVPLTGIFIILAWSIPARFAGRPRRRLALAAAAGAVLAVLSATAWGQVAYWRDAFSLYEHALEVTGKNWMISYNLGAAYGQTGHYDQAILKYREALRIKPDYVEALSNLGVAYAKTGQPESAVAAYREALRVNPESVNAWFNLGVTYLMANRPDLVPEVSRSLRRIDPAKADELLTLLER